jgi:hypothetical protein
MDIKFVKLRTGDELISEFTNDGERATLTNPVRLGIDPNTNSLRFIPYPMVAKETGTIIELNSADILFDIPVNNDCDQSYRKYFGHIVEAPKTLVI